MKGNGGANKSVEGKAAQSRNTNPVDALAQLGHQAAILREEDQRSPKMHWGLARTIILLPGTVLVFIPAVILVVEKDSKLPPELASPAQIWFWLALLAAIIGLALSVWTVTLFMKFGEGTPAPWDPPKELVIRGPYRFVRNPMITGVLLMLLAEALLFRSWPIAGWMMVFFIGNAIYFPLIEEKGLEKRFGDEYRKYKAHVPPWIPRLRAWKNANVDERNSS